MVKPHIIPNADLETDGHGAIVFSPQKLTCVFNEGNCFSMTNTETYKKEVYQDGVFDFTLYPNEVLGVGLPTTGTFVYTIPNTNPNTMITVTGK